MTNKKTIVKKKNSSKLIIFLILMIIILIIIGFLIYKNFNNDIYSVHIIKKNIDVNKAQDLINDYQLSYNDYNEFVSSKYEAYAFALSKTKKTPANNCVLNDEKNKIECDKLLDFEKNDNSFVKYEDLNKIFHSFFETKEDIPQKSMYISTYLYVYWDESNKRFFVPENPNFDNIDNYYRTDYKTIYSIKKAGINLDNNIIVEIYKANIYDNNCMYLSNLNLKCFDSFEKAEKYFNDHLGEFNLHFYEFVKNNGKYKYVL